MPGHGCKSRRKHTEITSERQRGFFGADLARARAGKPRRMKGITIKELESHLRESKGKKLPRTASARRGRLLRRKRKHR